MNKELYMCPGSSWQGARLKHVIALHCAWNHPCWSPAAHVLLWSVQHEGVMARQQLDTTRCIALSTCCRATSQREPSHLEETPDSTASAHTDSSMPLLQQCGERGIPTWHRTSAQKHTKCLFLKICAHLQYMYEGLQSNYSI